MFLFVRWHGVCFHLLLNITLYSISSPECFVNQPSVFDIRCWWPVELRVRSIPTR
ncbi:hypothetical protein M758_UG276500 [Ceratodon purpureus]|nr:hypothetical protein M758_UG276500 [Ceratodon purpureus]